MANQKHTNTKLIVSTSELSEIIGLSSRRIQQLAKDNIMVRVAHGKYDLPHSIQTYIEYIKEESQSSEELDLNKEKTLLTRANRMKAEMELKIMQGELHRAEDVERVMNDMLSSFRAQMLVVPGKAAPDIVGQTRIEKIKESIKKYVYEALQELSEYDPNVFYAESKDKINIESEEDTKEQGTKKEPREDGDNRRKTKK